MAVALGLEGSNDAGFNALEGAWVHGRPVGLRPGDWGLEHGQG